MVNVLLPEQKPLPFCIQTDASNKENQKMLPIAMHYFTPEDRIQHKIIDFIENPDEIAEGIVSCIVVPRETRSVSILC